MCCVYPSASIQPSLPSHNFSDSITLVQEWRGISVLLSCIIVIRKGEKERIKENKKRTERREKRENFGQIKIKTQVLVLTGVYILHLSWLHYNNSTHHGWFQLGGPGIPSYAMGEGTEQPVHIYFPILFAPQPWWQMWLLMGSAILVWGILSEQNHKIREASPQQNQSYDVLCPCEEWKASELFSLNVNTILQPSHPTLASFWCKNGEVYLFSYVVLLLFVGVGGKKRKTRRKEKQYDQIRRENLPCYKHNLPWVYKTEYHTAWMVFKSVDHVTGPIKGRARKWYFSIISHFLNLFGRKVESFLKRSTNHTWSQVRLFPDSCMQVWLFDKRINEREYSV